MFPYPEYNSSLPATTRATGSASLGEEEPEAKRSRGRPRKVDVDLGEALAKKAKKNLLNINKKTKKN